MAEQAKVSSIDALESFRAELVNYVEKARVALEDAEGEVRRTRTWLDVDRTNFWMREMKLRIKQMEMAEAEYYNARITRPTESHAFHKMAIAKAKRRVEEAEEKLRVIKHWRTQFDPRVTPLVRQLDPMFFQVMRHLPKGIHLLGESIKALQSYAEKTPITHKAPPVSTGETPDEGGAP